MMIGYFNKPKDTLSIHKLQELSIEVAVMRETYCIHLWPHVLKTWENQAVCLQITLDLCYSVSSFCI